MSEVASEKKSTPAAAIPMKISEPQSVRITTIQLNGDNFLHWSQFVPMYIRGQGKIGYTTWDAENSMVMTWLVNSMEEDISSNYIKRIVGQSEYDVF